MPLAPGTKLGPYEILAPPGAGGMGEVYRARDSRLGRAVEIKILPPSVSEDAERLDRFANEARVLSTLNHPNLLAIYVRSSESFGNLNCVLGCFAMGNSSSLYVFAERFRRR